MFLFLRCINIDVDMSIVVIRYINKKAIASRLNGR